MPHKQSYLTWIQVVQDMAAVWCCSVVVVAAVEEVVVRLRCVITGAVVRPVNEPSQSFTVHSVRRRPILVSPPC